MSFQLPNLPYAYDALEPHIDARTMEIHHTKHHNGYTTKLNDAIKGTDLEGKSIEDILRNMDMSNTAVRNNGGGYFNHNLFWKFMSPEGGGEPEGALADAITKDFGSFAQFKELFSATAGSHFGSGWAWLLLDADGKLQVSSLPNQDNPLMDVSPVQGTPLLNIDVWEHAYYLKYQNRRPEYIAAFFNVINWDEVARRYSEAKR